MSTTISVSTDYLQKRLVNFLENIMHYNAPFYCFGRKSAFSFWILVVNTYNDVTIMQIQ